MKDKDNYYYLKGFINGYSIQEFATENDFPDGFKNINEVWDRMTELKPKRQ